MNYEEDQALIQYIYQSIPETEDWVELLEKDAKASRIPIIEPLSAQLLSQVVRIKQPRHILEVGTAIGYSSLRMHYAAPQAQILTIEKNEALFQQARDNLARYRLKDHIEVVLADAREYLVQLRAEGRAFDFAFIDAAKGQYEQFFTSIDPMINRSGIILSDNVLFRGLVSKEEAEIPKRYKGLVKKLKAYNQFVLNHQAYDSVLLPIGDGILISIKK